VYSTRLRRKQVKGLLGGKFTRDHLDTSITSSQQKPGETQKIRRCPLHLPAAVEKLAIARTQANIRIFPGTRPKQQKAAQILSLSRQGLMKSPSCKELLAG
jgi:hypothetical protein